MRRLRFFNRQRVVAMDRVLLRRLSRVLLEDLLGRQDYDLGAHFIGADEMARLNQNFLGHEGSTDVITFNYQEDPGSAKICGEIFISIDDALVNARRFRVRQPLEVTRYLVHGVLHLEGFDDTRPAARRAMKRLENKLLKELSARFNLGKLAKSWRRARIII
jgi:rRNA maturation RNase YbeY